MNQYTSKSIKIPHSQKEEVKKQLEKLIKDKTIESSVLENNSLLSIVPKKY